MSQENWVWILVTLIAFALCTIIPIRIYKMDEEKRMKINWFVLIPISLVIILYAYPIGIRFFEHLATRHPF